MSVASAFSGVVLIWSTTPLAMKWSGEGVGFLFAVTARMCIGLLCLLALSAVLRRRLPWQNQEWRIYAVAGLGIYANMVTVFWAAQQIPSGWISVLFGLTPIVSTVLSRLWLRDAPFRYSELLGALTGLVGLMVMFVHSLDQSSGAVLGVVATLVSVFSQSTAAVWVKRLQGARPQPDGLALSVGGLLLAVPLLLLSWTVFDGHWPAEFTLRNSSAIVYLGAVGTGIGFTLYFHLLQQTSVNTVALITLLTPVIALWLGYFFGAEVISINTLAGTAIILAGLAISQFGSRLWSAAAQPRK